MQIVVGLIPFLAVLYGFFLCFFGFRMLKVNVGIMGFILVAALVDGAVAHGMEPDMRIITLLAAGLVGAAGMAAFPLPGVVMLGGGAGAIIGAFFTGGMDPSVGQWVSIALVAVMIVTAAAAHRFAMILVSSLFGSLIFLAEVFFFTDRGPELFSSLSFHSFPGLGAAAYLEQITGGRGSFLGIVLIVAAAGFVVQQFFTGSSDRTMDLAENERARTRTRNNPHHY